jgi:hypothetical protein
MHEKTTRALHLDNQTTDVIEDKNEFSAMRGEYFMIAVMMTSMRNHMSVA